MDAKRAHGRGLRAFEDPVQHAPINGAALPRSACRASGPLLLCSQAKLRGDRGKLGRIQRAPAQAPQPLEHGRALTQRLGMKVLQLVE
ncbi:MAG TPA: hypothetical protein VIC87_06025, partial [Vicinamibacteria bacterium]